MAQSKGENIFQRLASNDGEALGASDLRLAAGTGALGLSALSQFGSDILGAYEQFASGGMAVARGRIMAANADLAAETSRNNAVLARFSAEQLGRLGLTMANRRRGRAARLAGQQRASVAGQGVEVATGTAGAVAGQIEFVGELDALEIENNAARQALGMELQATQLEIRARAQEFSSAEAMRQARDQQKVAQLRGAAGILGAITNLPLNALGSVASGNIV